MWNDTSRQARKVAAQTLGRTGRGKCVHDEVLARLASPLASNRVEALRKINYVGIMTNQMLDVFLKCFRDDYTSVRELACTACQSLVYDKSDEKIIDALVHMVRFERAIKLKALAIRSLFCFFFCSSSLIAEYVMNKLKTVRIFLIKKRKLS